MNKIPDYIHVWFDGVRATYRRVEALPAKRGVPKGTELPPKYRHPGDPTLTWAGRGMMPKWLKQLLKEGDPIDMYEVKK